MATQMKARSAASRAGAAAGGAVQILCWSSVGSKSAYDARRLTRSERFVFAGSWKIYEQAVTARLWFS